MRRSSSIADLEQLGLLDLAEEERRDSELRSEDLRRLWWEREEERRRAENLKKLRR